MIVIERIERLKKLSNAYGVSGFEDDIQKEVTAQLPSNVAIQYDSMGNLIAQCKGKSNFPNVLIQAHADEIGFITTMITKEGFLKFRPLGRWSNNILLGQRVVIRSNGKSIIGIIGTVPPHVTSMQKIEKSLNIDEMFIDVGAKNDKEVYELGIRPGIPIVPYANFEIIGDEQRVIGKAFDDRVGLGVIIEAFIAVAKDCNHPNTITLASTVQEEIGNRGIRVLQNSVKPDVAIVLEGILACDIPGVTQDMVLESKLTGGTNIIIHDDSMLPNPILVDWIIGLANEEGIRIQLTAAYGSNDGGYIHLFDKGIPTIVIGVPCRYIHSFYGLMDLSDYEETIRLLIKVLQRLDKEIINKILKK